MHAAWQMFVCDCTCLASSAVAWTHDHMSRSLTPFSQTCIQINPATQSTGAAASIVPDPSHLASRDVGILTALPSLVRRAKLWRLEHACTNMSLHGPATDMMQDSLPSCRQESKHICLDILPGAACEISWMCDAGISLLIPPFTASAHDCSQRS